jgi:alanine racemase
MKRSSTLPLPVPDASEPRVHTRKSFAPPSIPPVYVEVDLEAVAANAREVQASVGPTCGVLAMLKADAYGHGLLPVALTLQQDRTIAGIVVSSVRDGLTLRRAGITLPVIALVCRYGNRHGMILDAGITPTVGSQADLDAFSLAARTRGRQANVHVELDTGMSRSGLREEDISPFLGALHACPEIVVSGLCTQLASADDERPVSAHRQLDAFERSCSRFRAAGHQPTMIHAANTAATSRMPRSHFTHVRVGIALFGGDEPSGAELRPAMRVTTRIAQLRWIGPGESVGYGDKWKASRRSLIATLPVGYAHGYPRRLLGRADVIVRQRRCPLIGSICMEMAMVDVTDVEGAALDDEVVLVGQGGPAEIRVAELARAIDGIVEEFFCSMPKVAMRTYARHSS